MRYRLKASQIMSILEADRSEGDTASEELYEPPPGSDSEYEEEDELQKIGKKRKRLIASHDSSMEAQRAKLKKRKQIARREIKKRFMRELTKEARKRAIEQLNTELY